ncbi:MAG: adenylyl cyclase [Candidatus Dormibacteraceae bacterium]
MRAFLSRLHSILVTGAIVAGASVVMTGAVATTALASSGAPDFGSNVLIFNPTMPQSEVQATLDSVSGQQVNNQFGTQRYALFFEPGTYGSAAHPLVFQVGYYTSVAGLGFSPNDVVVNGAIVSFNQCFGACTGLNNFWRSVSNLTLNIVLPKSHPTYAPAPPEDPDCANTNDLYAISQASPIRRVHVNGAFFLFDYCNTGFTSGGFIADSQFTGPVSNGSQQQFLVRNSQLGGWSNGVWNQVFSGVAGAPAQCFPCTNPYTTLATSPVTREAPFLYVDASGKYNVFAPSARRNSSGTSWSGGHPAGKTIPIGRFFIAKPGDSVDTINDALGRGKNLILTPGVYQLDRAIEVTRPDTIVLGLGFATLMPTDGNLAMGVETGKGVLLSGLLFDAGAENSRVLLQVGDRQSRGNDERGNGEGATADPAALTDVFFRIGGAAAGKATTSLVVNSDNTILDDVWAWRADHGTGVGWTTNTADTGVIVNGDNVTAYGLFVEHFQKYEVIWNGNGGTDVFFQNEMPYDVPSQAAWMEAPGVNGYAAFKIADEVTRFRGYGMGSYSFFKQHINIYAERAFEVPGTLPAGSLHDLLTIFLDKVNGSGGILHVVNETGGSSTIANPDSPVTVVSYP